MKFLLSRIAVIKAINDIEEIGLTNASDIYSQISYLTTTGYPTKQELVKYDSNFIRLLDFLKQDEVIDFDIPVDEDEYDYKKERENQNEKYAEAEAWLETLSDKEQEMVKTLMRSMIATAG